MGTEKKALTHTARPIIILFVVRRPASAVAITSVAKTREFQQFTSVGNNTIGKRESGKKERYIGHSMSCVCCVCTVVIVSLIEL